MGRISVVTDPDLVEEFRQFCFNHRPRVSMNNLLVQFIREKLGKPSDGKSTKRKPK